MSRAALLGTIVFVVAGLSGCATPAKIIHQDSNSVVVAVPENTNVWPWYHRDEADKAAATAIADPKFVTSTRVKVGEQTTNRQDTTRRDIPGREKSTIGEITSSLNTSSTSDTYEYHLVYERQNKSDVPNFSKPRMPAAPVPDGPPLVNPAGGIETPRVTEPANDVRIPMPANSLPMDLPATKLPAPGSSPTFR